MNRARRSDSVFLLSHDNVSLQAEKAQREGRLNLMAPYFSFNQGMINVWSWAASGEMPNKWLKKGPEIIWSYFLLIMWREGSPFPASPKTRRCQFHSAHKQILLSVFGFAKLELISWFINPTVAPVRRHWSTLSKRDVELHHNTVSGSHRETSVSSAWRMFCLRRLSEVDPVSGFWVELSRWIITWSQSDRGKMEVSAVSAMSDHTS